MRLHYPRSVHPVFLVVLASFSSVSGISKHHSSNFQRLCLLIQVISEPCSVCSLCSSLVTHFSKASFLLWSSSIWAVLPTPGDSSLPDGCRYYGEPFLKPLFCQVKCLGTISHLQTWRGRGWFRSSILRIVLKSLIVNSVCSHFF